MPLGIAKLNTLARIIGEGAPPASTRTPVTLTAISSAKISAAQSKFGGSSMLLTASSSDVVRATNVPVSTTFTYELWVRFNSLPSTFQMFIGSEGTANETYFGLYNNGGTLQYTSVIAGIDRRFTPAALATNTWIHLALIKDGATWKLYENGVETTVASTSGSVPTASGMFHSTMRIGSYYNNTYHFDGYMDEIRYSDIVRYTTNFTPSTSAFTNDANTVLLVHANDYNGSTTFVDDGGQTLLSRTPATLTANGNIQVSTAQSKFGTGSILGDGSGDFISTPFRLDYDIARTTNFTVECWIRPNTPSSYMGIVNNMTYNTTIGWGLYMASGQINFLDASQNYTNLVTSGITFSANTWYHIALVRSGSNLNIYVDGISRASINNYTSKNPTSGPLRIGEAVEVQGGGYAQPGSGYQFNGYIDEFRISNTARYTSNFTPSTTAFTNDDNTVILVHGDGYTGYTTFIDDAGQTIQTPSRAPVTLTVNGNAQISTLQSKFGGASALFDGSGDYLDANGLSNIGTGDFTIELWARHSVVNTNQMYLDARPTSTNGAYPGLFFLGSTSKPYYYFNTDVRITADNALAANTWYHIAIVRSSGVTKMYIDGTTQTETYTDSSNITNSLVTIGAAQFDISRIQSVNGYLDEFRISNIARYTSNFTPSTTAFTNDANTLLLIHANDYNGSTDFIDDNGVNPVFRTDSYSTYLKLAVPFDKYYGVKDIAYLIKSSGSTSARTQGSSSTMSALDRYWFTSQDYERSLLNTRDGSALTYSIDGNIPSSASGTFVVEGWFKPTDNNTNQNWVLSSADSNGRWLFAFNTGGSMGFGSENNIGFGSSTWQHMAIVCDGGTKRFYLNGVYKGAWVSSNTGFTTLHIGQFNSGDANDYRGYIQDFRVYVGTNKGYTGTNSSSANFTLPSSIIESY